MTTQLEQTRETTEESQELDSPRQPVQERRIRPEADIYRSKHAVRLVLDLPGARDEDIDVEVHDGVLTVEARVERDEQEVRRYQRSFRLDRKMDSHSIEAKLERGVLHLHIPFHEEAQPKKIAIQSS